MILEKSGNPRHAFLVGAHYTAAAHHLPGEELGVPQCELAEIIPIEYARRGSRSAQHEAVPGCEDLIVAPGPRAPRSRLEQNTSATRDNLVEHIGLDVRSSRGDFAIGGDVEDAFPLEVSASHDAVIGFERARIRAE